MSHRCMVNELQRFPVLRKRMDEVVGNFLREGLEPSETMIGHIVEMEMDYINTSHPSFIGGSKALEMALQDSKSSKIVAANIPRNKGVRPAAEVTVPSGSTTGSAWGISSIFGGGSDNRTTIKENLINKPFIEPVQNIEHAFSSIQLREVHSAPSDSEAPRRMFRSGGS